MSCVGLFTRQSMWSLLTRSCDFPLGMTRKSLQRLFPCDTNMVVIIDDRADVWDGSPNLVKVIPCGSSRLSTCSKRNDSLTAYCIGRRILRRNRRH